MTNIDFQDLAEKYGFPDPYELELQHGQAVYLSGLSKRTEQRDVFRDIETHCKALHEALDSLGFQGIQLLRTELDSSYIEADKLAKQAMSCCNSLGKAAESIAGLR